MRRQPDSAALDFEDRLALLVDRERLERDNKRLHTRLRFAGLRVQATPGGCRLSRRPRASIASVPKAHRRRMD